MPDLDELIEYALIGGIILGVVNLAYGIWYDVFSAWMALYAGASALTAAILFLVNSITQRSRILFRDTDNETIQHYGLTLGNWRPGAWAIGAWTWEEKENE